MHTDKFSSKTLLKRTQTNFHLYAVDRRAVDGSADWDGGRDDHSSHRQCKTHAGIPGEDPGTVLSDKAWLLLEN